MLQEKGHRRNAGVLKKGVNTFRFKEVRFPGKNHIDT